MDAKLNVWLDNIFLAVADGKGVVDTDAAIDMAMGIFKEMKHYMQHGSPIDPIPASEKMALLRRQIRESIDRIDEYRGILHIRRHLAATPLFKGIPNFRETRIAMLKANTFAELDEILNFVEEKFLYNNQ